MGFVTAAIRTHTRHQKIRRESRKLGFVLYEAFYRPIMFLKVVYRQLLVLLAMFLWGAVIFVHFEQLPFLDALLASVSTITTIGLYVPNGGNFLSLNRTEAGLLIVMIIVSVGAGASIVQDMVSSVVSGELAKGEAEKHLISKLSGHIIVYGFTHMGRYVADKLDEIGFDYVVITKNPEVYHELLNKDTYATLEHELQPIEALKSAGI